MKKLSKNVFLGFMCLSLLLFCGTRGFAVTFNEIESANKNLIAPPFKGENVFYVDKNSIQTREDNTAGEYWVVEILEFLNVEQFEKLQDNMQGNDVESGINSLLYRQIAAVFGNLEGMYGGGNSRMKFRASDFDSGNVNDTHSPLIKRHTWMINKKYSQYCEKSSRALVGDGRDDFDMPFTGWREVPQQENCLANYVYKIVMENHPNELFGSATGDGVGVPVIIFIIVLGIVISLVIAMLKKKQKRKAKQQNIVAEDVMISQIEKYKKLMDAGIITSQEFEIKKKELLVTAENINNSVPQNGCANKANSNVPFYKKRGYKVISVVLGIVGVGWMVYDAYIVVGDNQNTSAVIEKSSPEENIGQQPHTAVNAVQQNDDSSNKLNDDLPNKSNEEDWQSVGNGTTYKRIADNTAIVKMVKSKYTETYEMCFYDDYFVVNSVSADESNRNRALQNEVGIKQSYANNPRVDKVREAIMRQSGNKR